MQVPLKLYFVDGHSVRQVLPFNTRSSIRLLIQLLQLVSVVQVRQG